MDYILSVKGLEKNYGERKAVDSISFNLKDSEILGLLGPNGAGKSTTINMISTVVDYDGGNIFFNGAEVKTNKSAFKRSMGVVPQDIAIFNDLSAYDNVKFFCSLYGFSGKELRENIAEALNFVGLWDRRKELPSQFSGGMKRRLNIACSIAHHPRLLIMDEPTVGIDPQSRNNILETVKELNNRGTTIIYTSHYMEEVEHICSNIIIMDEGKILEEGTNEYLKSKYSMDNLEEVFLDLTGKELRD